MAWSAAARLPASPRSSSCVLSVPSIDTETLITPASRAWRALSRVNPRPPVTREHSIPCARMARTISVQSSRRYASPPMSVTSSTPSCAIWSTRSSASAVDSSSGRARPARELQ